MRKIVGLIFLALCACGTESSTEETESPLGVLVECDEVIEEVGGEVCGPDGCIGTLVTRHKVAYVPVEDPLSVTLTHCGMYEGSQGGPLEPPPRNYFDCVVGGGLSRSGVIFTPDFRVYVECEREETIGGTPSSVLGNERVYLRESPNRVASANENLLGVPVECNEVVEESMPDGDVVRRHVAYVPVEDPTSVTITRCGEYYVTDGRTTWSTTDCEANKSATFTADSHVVVECGDERMSGSGAHTHSYEQIYLRENADAASRPSESPFGALVECDEVLEWEFSPGTAHATLHRLSVAYVPVADPTSVTITRCGEYKIAGNESTHSDACVSGEGAIFTEDFEVYVKCEQERTGWLSDIKGYDRIYLRAD